jgi:hypothetical protein
VFFGLFSMRWAEEPVLLFPTLVFGGAALAVLFQRHRRSVFPSIAIECTAEPTAEVPPLPNSSRRTKSEKARVNKLNKLARLDRLMESIFERRDDSAGLPSCLLDMARPLLSTGTPSLGRLDWPKMPDTCDPFRVAVRMAGTPRGLRKRETVEAFAWLLEQILMPEMHCNRASGQSRTPTLPADIPTDARRVGERSLESLATRPTIVDLGCSSGSLILALAFAFPEAHFIGVDLKPSSLALLRARAAKAGLSSSISTWEGRIEEYEGPCDVVLSLHACGGASDAALQLAARRAVRFAVSPCCIGALPVGVAPGGRFGSDARGASSGWLRAHIRRAAAAEAQGRGVDIFKGGKESDMFALLAATADASSHLLQDPDGEGAARQRRAKRLVEIDRLAAMPGEGLGGWLLRIGGKVMSATSAQTDVLVGPPEALWRASASASACTEREAIRNRPEDVPYSVDT